MDFENVVQQELNTLIADGTFNNIIKSKLTKTIEDIVNTATQSYSDFGKRLKTAVEEEVLKINMSDFKLVDYNTVVCNVIREQLDNTLYQSTVKHITDAVKEYTGVLDKKEWTISEIIEKFVKEIEEEKQGDGEYDEGHISFHCKGDGNFKWISWDKDDKKSEYGCEYRIGIYKDHISSFQAGEYHPHNGDIRTSGRTYGFAAFLFKLYANGVKIKIDEHEVETGWCSHSN